MSGGAEAFYAARVGDGIEHTASKGWLVLGLIGGAIAGAAFTLATGGVGTVVLAATVAGAAGGGGLGEVLGGMSWAPHQETGHLVTGSSNVFINGRSAVMSHMSVGDCDEHGPAFQRVAEGSSRVYINGLPAARTGDRLACSGIISSGSPNVIIGGDKEQTDVISPEIPEWVDKVLLAVGLAATAVLAGPAIALLSFAGGMGGGYGGSYIGGKLWGEGSDRQKWLSLGGAFAGGLAGAKGGAAFNAWRNTPKSLINLKEIEPQLATDPDSAFFWSGRTESVGGPEIAEAIAKSRDGVTLESTLTDKNIEMPRWDPKDPLSIKAWEEVSASYARQVSGEVRAVVGQSLRKGNIWENVELPRLMGNDNVTKITTIDPMTQSEKVIFIRDN
ncbi:PAAR domain-containing protein [Pantoea agglomerans]|jgi:uncharacterized Zn-binding protein involved in type VI secretion|uniref:PAAR domain-containing protein n=1 Tax=Enterobacter agglomerans TaxID=549 RepID=UPI002D798C9F|nr:PAAR domain-containing protein [Pantoea agglomerans]WRO89457.1 PAAR domain-containing protein [Pantoea agglomerans]